MADEAEDLRDEIRELKAQLTEAREVLKLVEWQDYRGELYCSVCKAIAKPHGQGHAPDCRLAKVLNYASL